MEDTLNSSINKAISPKQKVIHDSQDEESGWTAYFDDLDFSNNNNNNNIEQQQQHGAAYSCSSFSNPSLISDAASCVAWKVTDHIASSSPNTPKKLCFKKSKTKEISYVDDSLEDTASSPVSSPKGNTRPHIVEEGISDRHYSHVARVKEMVLISKIQNCKQMKEVK